MEKADSDTTPAGIDAVRRTGAILIELDAMEWVGGTKDETIDDRRLADKVAAYIRGRGFRAEVIKPPRGYVTLRVYKRVAPADKGGRDVKKDEAPTRDRGRGADVAPSRRAALGPVGGAGAEQRPAGKGPRLVVAGEGDIPTPAEIVPPNAYNGWPRDTQRLAANLALTRFESGGNTNGGAR